MIVLEYVTKFERLARYAPELVDTMQKKVTKFLEGLNPIIERDVTGVVPPATFDEVVKRAYKFENINNKIIEERKQFNQQNQRQQESKKPSKEHVDIVGRIMRLVNVARPWCLFQMWVIESCNQGLPTTSDSSEYEPATKATSSSKPSTSPKSSKAISAAAAARQTASSKSECSSSPVEQKCTRETKSGTEQAIAARTGISSQPCGCRSCRRRSRR